MESEVSYFETSEMLATFLASTQLLPDSWRLCAAANSTAPQGFATDQTGTVGYLAFSGIQTVPGGSDAANFGDLVPLDGGDGLFSPLRCRGGEPPVMVHAGLLRLFLSFYGRPDFQSQMLGLMQNSKSIVITGHSIGATTASLTALWLLSHFQSSAAAAPISVLCITFGSPLLGDASLTRAVLRQRWGGNFCHTVSKHDIMPRLLFAPPAPLTPHLHALLQFWHLSLTSPHFGKLAVDLGDGERAELFRVVCMEMAQLVREGLPGSSTFWPFGSYLFVSEEGAICLDNAESVVKMLYLMLTTSSPNGSVEDHLKYGDYVGKVSMKIMNKGSFMQDDLSESSYEAGVAMALESSGISTQDMVSNPAKDCLKIARRMGRTPSLNSANLAIKLSHINPYRAEIEWYKASCDDSDDQMGYYDAFKSRGSSRKDSRVNMNRHKLALFWNQVIDMLDKNALPFDFDRRAKWVNASQSYKLLVEPLEIAEYYRTGMHITKGHYRTHGREMRFEIFDRWWSGRQVGEEESKPRNKNASLTQDTLFWAKVEEAREWLDKVRSERDVGKLAMLWAHIDEFARYACELVEKKEVSEDVLKTNSSYSLWAEDWKVLKSQLQHFKPQLPTTGFMDEVV